MWRTRLAQMEQYAGHKAEAQAGAGAGEKQAHQEMPPDEGGSLDSSADDVAGEGGIEEMLAFSQAARGEAEVLIQEGDEGAVGQDAIPDSGDAVAPLPADQAIEAGDAAKEDRQGDELIPDGKGDVPEVVPPEAGTEVEGSGVAPWAPRRRSAIVETAMILAALVKQRLRTLAFCKVRATGVEATDAGTLGVFLIIVGRLGLM